MGIACQCFILFLRVGRAVPVSWSRPLRPSGLAAQHVLLESANKTIKQIETISLFQRFKGEEFVMRFVLPGRIATAKARSPSLATAWTSRAALRSPIGTGAPARSWAWTLI